MVVSNGNPIQRGMLKPEAERFADRLSKGLDSHKPGSWRLTPHIEIKRDTEANRELNDAYKDYRRER
ncbi:MAG: hypothetical protein CV089_02130 [Nitrospira sp. WS110]|nr:hypothetical protein [Nitrospira sp. WS110]